MPFGIIAGIVTGISLGLQLANAIKPIRPRRPRPPSFDGPTADEGRGIPIVYGQFAIAPNVVWWKAPGPKRHAHSDVVDYTAWMLTTVCHGPIDEITDIQMGGKSLRLAAKNGPPEPGNPANGTAYVDPPFPIAIADPDTPVEIEIDAIRLFGDGSEGGEGGPRGEVRFCAFELSA